VSTQFFPLASAAKQASLLRTFMANSTIRLFKSSFVPSVSNVLADYNAAQCDYDSYAAITMPAWLPAILSPGSGYMVGSPLVQFEFPSGGAGVGNLVGGCYVLDAAGALALTVIFTQPIPMQLPGQGIPINLLWFFSTGLTTG